MANLVIRVWLPDRPGGLGLVASRIGAIGGDIVGIEVLERSEQVAVDEFCVVLGDHEHVKLLIREIEEVDGVSVEECRAVEQFTDPSVDALEAVELLCAASGPSDVAIQLVRSVHAEFAADWTCVLRRDRLLAAAGTGMPPVSVLDALTTGTAASPAVAAGEAGPDDLAVAPLATSDAVLLVGRGGHPFRRRERRQLLAIARIADRITARDHKSR